MGSGSSGSGSGNTGSGMGSKKNNPAQVTKEKVDHTLEAQGPPQALQAPPAVRGPRA